MRTTTILILLFTCVSTFAASSETRPYKVFTAADNVQSTVFMDRNYQHAPTVAEFKGRVFVAWNGNLHNASEGQPGQVIFLRSSADGGLTWGELQAPFIREYRAFDDIAAKAVDARPGSADNDHLIGSSGARQWQPAMVSFKNKLLMFWGQDRGAPGSAMMMSILEEDSAQWRSHELNFKSDGSVYFTAIHAGKRGSVGSGDVPYVKISSQDGGTRYGRITGFDKIPQQIRISDAKTSESGMRNDEKSSLIDHRLIPSAQHAVALKDSDGNDILAVAIILHQIEGDWNNETLKVPATLITRDMVNWQLSIVPLRSGKDDFLGDERGDVGLISAWEPSITVDALGIFHMMFRLNVPPRLANGGPPAGRGYRVAETTGSILPNGAVAWSVPNLVDIDVPVSRGQLLRRGNTNRWLLVHNNSAQGVAYKKDGVPIFSAEKYEPWARENLSLFFSTRGAKDFVSGVNLSGYAETQGVELVHYPYAQSITRQNGEDEVLIVYSTHRRVPACFQKKSNVMVDSCHDTIQFMRLTGLPDPTGAFIYPNKFSTYYEYGRGELQDKSYIFSSGQLTLFDRGSAGIDTFGDKGCLNLRFQLGRQSSASTRRPILSFGRTADRVGAIGLVAEGVHKGADSEYVLSLVGNVLPGKYLRGQWVSSRVCYDFVRKVISSQAIEVPAPTGFSPATYLGDPTLGRVGSPLPDLIFDVGAMSIDSNFVRGQ